MHSIHFTRRMAVVLTAAVILVGAGMPAATAQERGPAEKEHENHGLALGHERRGLKPPAPAEIKGNVLAVSAAAGTFDVTVRPGQTATASTTVTVHLGTPSIVTLNEQAATLTDIHVNDRVNATTVNDATGHPVAYVAKFNRPLPPAPKPARVQGLVASVLAASNTFTLTVHGLPKTISLASPAIVTLNGAAATLADIHVNDQAMATGITDTAGATVAFHVVFTR